MKKVLAVATAFAIASSVLYAGGPVVVQEEAAVVAEKPASSAGWVLPVVLLALIGLAVASGNDDGPINCS
jgi:hypothetical protein